jgi:signal peptidase I
MKKQLVKKSKSKYILNGLFWVVLIVIALYSLTALFSEQDSNARTLFGTTTLSVQSDSMKPTFSEGDLIFVNTNFVPEDLVKDVVITYKEFKNTPTGPVMIYNTHRIISVVSVGSIKWYYTQGDNNATPDTSPVLADDILGIWTGGKIAGLGTFADTFISFIKSSLGFFLFIVVPCFLFLVYEIFRFVKVMSEYNVNKSLGDRAQLQVEALALARAQIEAELRQKQEEQLQSDQKKE